MYEATGPLRLHGVNQQHLLRRQYESEEDDTSESEMGGQEIFSPIYSRQAPRIFDSDLSADEFPSMDPESDVENTKVPDLRYSLLSTSKSSRPVSMDTIKRSSGATFVADTFHFDHDDEEIIELPSPDQPSPLQSPVYLQPTVYAPPKSPRSVRSLSMQSPSPVSVFSDDGTEPSLFVAKKVTYMEPNARPNVILVNPLTQKPSYPKDESSLLQRRRSGWNSRSNKSPRESPERERHETPRASLSYRRSTGFDAAQLRCASSDRRLVTHLKSASPRPSRNEAEVEEHVTVAHDFVAKERASGGSIPERLGPSATITCLSEIPQVPQQMSPRSMSMSFSRPWTSTSERPPSKFLPSRSRRLVENARLPPLRSISNTSLPVCPPRSASPYASDDQPVRSTSSSHYMHGSDAFSPLRTSRPSSRTSSHTPYYSSPTFSRDRSGSMYSSSSVQTTHSPLVPRTSAVKHSAAPSIISMSSLRSEVDGTPGVDPNTPADQSFKEKANRKKLLKRSRYSKKETNETTESSSTGKIFMGFKLGKRKSMKLLS